MDVVDHIDQVPVETWFSCGHGHDWFELADII
jgi:hypothetical protein